MGRPIRSHHLQLLIGVSVSNKVHVDSHHTLQTTKFAEKCRNWPGFATASARVLRLKGSSVAAQAVWCTFSPTKRPKESTPCNSCSYGACTSAPLQYHSPGLAASSSLCVLLPPRTGTVWASVHKDSVQAAKIFPLLNCGSSFNFSATRVST